MLIETIHAVGLDENVLADELYYRKFRPIGVVLQNLPNADPKRKEQSYQLFYQNIAKLDLTGLLNQKRVLPPGGSTLFCYSRN